MSVFDTFTQARSSSGPAPSDTAPVEPEAKPESPGLLSKVGSFFSGIFGGNKAAPVNAAPKTAEPIDQKEPKSVYDTFKQSQTKNTAAPKSVYDTFKASQTSKSVPSPYFSKKEPSGAVLGFSDEKDTSGKPLFAYRNPGDTATTTDKTRVATTFDPTKPQKIDSKAFYNPRDPNVTKLRGAMGASYNQELDHVQPLELSGSNKTANLQTEDAVDTSKAYGPGNPTPTDSLENKLKSDVSSGKISLLDAQVQMAKAKGKAAPWVPPEYRSGPTSTWDQFKNYVKDLFTSKQAKADTKPASVYETYQKSTGNTTDLSSEDGLHKEAARLSDVEKDIVSKSERLMHMKEHLDPSDEKAISDYNDEIAHFNTELTDFQIQAGAFNTAVDSHAKQAQSDAFDAYEKSGGSTIGPAKGDTIPMDDKPAWYSVGLPIPEPNAIPDIDNPLKLPTVSTLNAATQTVNSTVKSAVEFINSLDPRQHYRPTEIAKKGVEAGINGINLLPPVLLFTSVMKGSEDLPGVIGQGAHLINNVFSDLGDIGSKGWKMTGGKVVDKLPFSPKTKQDINDIGNEIASFGSQMATLALFHGTLKDSSERLNELIETAAEKKANGIELSKSEKLADGLAEAKAHFQNALAQGFKELKAIPNKQGGFVAVSKAPTEKEALDSQRDDVALRLSKLDSNDFMNESGKVNLDLFSESQDIQAKIEKGTDTPEDMRRGAEILATLGKESPALKAAPGLSDDTLSTKLLEQLKGRETVSKQFIQDLTNQGDLKQTERDIIREALKDEKDTVNVKDFTDKVKSELLPLTTISPKDMYSDKPSSGLYENVSLDKGLRGSVENYQERIYQSPIKTSAGNVHFPNGNGIGSNADKYFGHSRIEDMSDGSTRRVIEVQSDLYQKGNLEAEGIKYAGKSDAEIRSLLKESNPKLKYDDESIKNLRAIGDKASKLAQYNNPTAHFRMVREEVRQAAIDGKKNLLFPTGETAMKIEGLGENNAWLTRSEKGEYHAEGFLIEPKPVMLRVGRVMEQAGGSQWIITDVLGDGKFKAIPRNQLPRSFEYMESNGKTRFELPGGIRELRDGRYDLNDFIKEYPRHHAIETFDISGKVDTNNPIYRFYEKDLGRYLKNQYDAKPFTDDKGVTWYKVDVKPEYGKKPVQAFKLHGKGENVAALAKAQGVEFNTDIKDAPKLVSKFFNKDEMTFLFPDKIEGAEAWGRATVRKAFQNPLIEVVQHDGKISDAVLYHEAFHGFFRQFVSPEERKAVIDELIKNPLVRAKMKLVYEKPYGKDLKIQAEEYAADMFADYIKGKDVPLEAKGVFQTILEKIKGWIRKLTGLDKIFDRAENKDRSFTRTESRRLTPESFEKKKSQTPSIHNRKNMNEDVSVEEELAREAAGFNVVNQNHALALVSLEDKGYQLEIEREALENNPARGLSKYVSRGGEFKGRLREVTGQPGTKFGQKGDDIITELGFTDSEQARDAWERYAKHKEAFDKKVKDFQDSKRELYQKFREDKDKYGGSTTHPAGRDYNMEITEANKGIVPPAVRGGIQAPEMDLTKFKDIAVPRLGRDTMERNLEKVAGPYAAPLKDFIVEPVRSNEVDRIKFANDIRLDTRAQMKNLGIKVRSDEADLIQRYGEGYLSIEELRKATPKWKEVISASEYFRKVYDRLIDAWNDKRAKFGYSAVPKRQDYFRHFSDINEFTNQFGILRSESQLPTAIAGLSSNFKPGKPFSTAELSRSGNMTSYDAIRGMDNYLDSVSKQMFHIDSIQRGRALEKYIRKVAKENPSLTLPNFVQNVEEWTNLVSGKAAKLDRAIESTVGRPVMKFMLGLSRVLGRNIVVGNLSVAMTHLVSLPLNLATVDKVPFLRGALSTLTSPFRAAPMTVIDGMESSFLTRRYPEKYIQPTVFNKIENTLGFLFHVTDVFKSRLAVESKYYQLKEKGWKDGSTYHQPTDTPEFRQKALAEADRYAGRIVGDYSIGNRPNILNTHTTQLIAQFQLGINDGVSVLLHDIPHWEEENKGKIAYKLAQFMVFAYLFNQVYKQIRGSGKALDPIDAGLTLAGLNDEGSGEDFMTRLKQAGGDILGELPGGSIVTGGFPLAQAFPVVDLVSGKLGWQAFVKQLIADFASPIGGGTQVKKSIEGIQSYNQGYTTTAAGKINQTVEKTPTNLLKGLIFGKTGFSNAKGQTNETNRLLGLVSSKAATSQQEAESLYEQMKDMPADQAAKTWDELHAKDARLADRVSAIATDAKAGMTLNERLIKQLGVTNGQRANYIYKQLKALKSDKERADLWDRYTELKIISPNVSEQLTSLLKK